MQTPDVVDKWPWVTQIGAGIGTAIAAYVAWRHGKKRKPSDEDLQEEVEDLRRKQEFTKLRADLELVMGSIREHLEAEIEDLRRTVHKLEVEVARNGRHSSR